MIEPLNFKARNIQPGWCSEQTGDSLFRSVSKERKLITLTWQTCKNSRGPGREKRYQI